MNDTGSDGMNEKPRAKWRTLELFFASLTAVVAAKLTEPLWALQEWGSKLIIGFLVGIILFFFCSVAVFSLDFFEALEKNIQRSKKGE